MAALCLAFPTWIPSRGFQKRCQLWDCGHRGEQQLEEVKAAAASPDKSWALPRYGCGEGTGGAQGIPDLAGAAWITLCLGLTLLGRNKWGGEETFPIPGIPLCPPRAPDAWWAAGNAPAWRI